MAHAATSGGKAIDFLAAYRLPLLLTLVALAGTYAPVLWPMVQDWLNDENYSHGFLVPLVSAVLVYRQRHVLAKQEAAGSLAGMLLVAASLLLLVVGRVGNELFTQRSSFILCLSGIIYLLLGKKLLQMLLPALLFLFFMIPLPYIAFDAVAFPLKLAISFASVLLLQAAGITVLREGNLIMFPEFTLEVADACSGIRSMISLMAFGVAYGLLYRFPGRVVTLLALLALPLALLVNGARVVFTGVVCRFWGSRAAEGFFHECTGMVMFAAGTLLLVAAGNLLLRKSR